MTGKAPASRGRRGLALRGAMLAAAAVLGVAGWFGGLAYGPNLHEVVPGDYYRSAQLSPDELTRVIRAEGIRTVVNLRGSQDKASWYAAEARAAQAAGATLQDFRMSSRQSLSEADADRLVALLRAAPKPVLVHCEGGADRTGLASALYLLAIRGEPADRAGGQLSVRYGHVGARALSGAWPMDESWQRLAPRYAADQGAR